MFYGRPHNEYRQNVSEPVSPFIVLPIYEDREAKEMHLSVPQALELANLLIAAVQSFIKRGDVNRVLLSQEPGSHT